MLVLCHSKGQHIINAAFFICMSCHTRYVKGTTVKALTHVSLKKHWFFCFDSLLVKNLVRPLFSVDFYISERVFDMSHDAAKSTTKRYSEREREAHRNSETEERTRERETMNRPPY